jgi:predicted secreted acid phosphatase
VKIKIFETANNPDNKGYTQEQINQFIAQKNIKFISTAAAKNDYFDKHYVTIFYEEL